MQEADIVCEQLAVSRKTLRIAVVTETYPPEINGVAMSIARFVQGLQKRDHEIQLIRPRQNSVDDQKAEASPGELLTRGMPIPRYPNLRMGLPVTGVLLRQWTRSRPDIVHIVTEGPLGWSALRAALKLKLPVTSDFRTNFHAYSHHYGIGWLSRPIAAYLRKFHNRTRMTMVPTESMRKELALMGITNAAVVTRGVDIVRFSPLHRSDALRRQWGAGPADAVILHVGRLAPEKNLSLLLKAYSAVRQSAGGTKLVIVGDGPLRTQLQSEVPEAIFAGMRSGDDLSAHYASADIFAFPSTTETFGNVTVEAMASGLAVVAYDYAAASEHIRDEDNGVLVPFDAGALFVQEAVQLAGDPARIARLRAAARQSAEKLDWARVVLRLETLLMSVVEAEAMWPVPHPALMSPTLAPRP